MKSLIMAISKSYIDSYYLLEIVFEGTAKNEAEKLLTQLMNPSFETIIPQIVLGETVSQICQKYNGHELSEKMGKFSDVIDKYKINVNSGLVPPSFNSFDIMYQLHQRDSWLDPTDIVILSHALADPYSKFFFTPDENLVGNRTIISYEQELRGGSLRSTKLKIIDGL